MPRLPADMESRPDMTDRNNPSFFKELDSDALQAQAHSWAVLIERIGVSLKKITLHQDPGHYSGKYTVIFWLDNFSKSIRMSRIPKKVRPYLESLPFLNADSNYETNQGASAAEISMSAERWEQVMLAIMNCFTSADRRLHLFPNFYEVYRTPPSSGFEEEGTEWSFVFDLASDITGDLTWKDELSKEFFWTLHGDQFPDGTGRSSDGQEIKLTAKEIKACMVSEGKALKEENPLWTIPRIAEEIAHNNEIKRKCGEYAPTTIERYLKGHGIGKPGRPKTPVK